MKYITVPLMILLIGLMGCASHVAPYCQKPVKPALQEVKTDKDLLEAFNQVVDYSLGLESTIQCYEKMK